MTALSVPTSFVDRTAAGKALASALSRFAGRREVVVLGMPRGGVIVAKAVADSLRVPLDVVVARKLGVPGLAEVALGAMAEGSEEVVPDHVSRFIGVPRDVVQRIADRERAELLRRVTVFRGGRPMAAVRDRVVVIVDDGFATGATLRAAAAAVRRARPREIVAAVPVGSRAHCDDVRASVDELVVLETPEPFETVSAHYESFPQVTDHEVLEQLGHTMAVSPPDEHTGSADGEEREVQVPIGDGALMADLGIPDEKHVRGLVILAHGGGSSRHSYRNRYLAGRLRMSGWATLRVDLLLEHEVDEDDRGDVRFDVARIGDRLRCAVEWAAREGVAGGERIVLFGASTGAAAAAVAAANSQGLVTAVISRGGRIDLAAEALPRVRCPVLMIVGSNDRETLRYNMRALSALKGPTRLKVIRRAGHTFEEPGALGAVGEVAAGWLCPRKGRFRGWLARLGFSTAAIISAPDRLEGSTFRRGFSRKQADLR